MNITQEPAGHSAEGLPLSIFTLGNRRGMAVRVSTRGGALLSLHAPDRHGLLANVLRAGQGGDGVHVLPAPGRALHRQAWHAVPLTEDASVGVRLVSPGAPSVVVRYVLDDANTLWLHWEVAAAAAVALCLPLAFHLGGAGPAASPVGSHLLMLPASRVVPAGAHEQAVDGTRWDCRTPRPVGEVPAPARYLFDGVDQPGAASVLRLADPDSGRLLELAGAVASIRVARAEPGADAGGVAPGHLLLEALLAAPSGSLAFRFGVQA